MKASLEALFSKNERKVVGVLTGELLETAQFIACESNLLRLEWQAFKATFTFRYAKSLVVDGKMLGKADELRESSIKKFNSEKAKEIASFHSRQEEINQRKKSLWERIYEQFDIPSCLDYGIDDHTGEVYEE